jgi:hypothetical protein
MSEGRDTGTFPVKRGLAEMMKGGVIMDVVTPEQAKIAEDAGAVAVMALERVPADIRRDGGVARMSDPEMIEGIEAAVSIPVMAKARIGHFVEAQILQALGVDFIDESEVLTPADETHHIDKFAFEVPFVCGATNLGEALRRIASPETAVSRLGLGSFPASRKRSRTPFSPSAECSALHNSHVSSRRSGRFSSTITTWSAKASATRRTVWIISGIGVTVPLSV